MTFHSLATITTRSRWAGFCLALVMITQISQAQEARPANILGNRQAVRSLPSFPPGWFKQKYVKQEIRIPMRDGVKLFTSIYMPREITTLLPILMTRTPYSVAPYGEDVYPDRPRGNPALIEEGYIFVSQDVRGRYMSEGKFQNMTPHVPNKKAGDTTAIDESTDTYDTVDWLVKNLPNNNGKVGLWGISYPGFYAAAGMIDHHPSLVAVSPQAPIADWFFDDFHHHGATFLPHSFNFIAVFGQRMDNPTTRGGTRFDHGTPDGYEFFLKMGSLANANSKYFQGGNWMWNELAEHPNYDEFWQKRNLLPHLKNTSPAVLTVGGWYDAEDLYGPLKIYREIEKNSPKTNNAIVMGPWVHGGWHRGPGSVSLGEVHFGSNTSEYYFLNIEKPFFDAHLKGKGAAPTTEAYVFETGRNRWHNLDSWPPRNATPTTVYLAPNRSLSLTSPTADQSASDAFPSDPSKPVPSTAAITTNMNVEYMVEDQRFAASRPDVLSYQTEPLAEDMTIAGPLLAKLFVSTDQTDADWVVKLIDVHPSDYVDASKSANNRKLASAQIMVRSEVIRGRFRESYSDPKPFEPNKVTPINLELLDVLHTFRKGHRVMVQIQSTWFPLVDRNPQKYVPNIFNARDDDFTPAVHRVFHTPQFPSRIEFSTARLPKE